jgi:hypothetical protein
MVDRVQLTKYETSALGGDDADTLPYPAPIAPQEDAIEVAGVYLQDASNRDETVLIDRNGDDMRFTDPNNSGGVTLSALVRSVSKVGTPVNNELAVWTGDGTIEGESELTYDGATLSITGDLSAQKAALTGPIRMTEVAAADADEAGKGQIWVKDNTPNDLYFTDDTGVDHLVSLTETDYAKLGGRSGGQTLYGGTEASQNLTLGSTASATKGFIYFGAASGFDETNVELGIGTLVPDQTLHVHKSSAGTIDAHSKSWLVVEAADHAYINFLSSSGKEQGLIFGEAGDSNNVAGLFYTHSTDEFYVAIGGTTYLNIDSSGNVQFPQTTSTLAIGGNFTPDSTVHVWAGSAGTVSALAGTQVTIEDNATAYLSFLTPNTATAGILFGDPEDNDVGQVTYSHSANQLSFTDGTTGTKTLAQLAAAGGGNVSASGTPVDNQIAVWTDALTIEGTSAFTFSGTELLVSASTPIGYLKDGTGGAAALSRTMAGLQMSSIGMDNTSKYTPAVKFMSTDSAFTTENPKFLAGIVGRATENYGADTDGGMALDFAVTADDPGTTNVPAVGMSLTHNGTEPRLGIGTDSPTSMLHVKGTSYPSLYAESTDTSGGQLLLYSSAGGWSVYAQSADLRFYDSADRVTLEAGGNVGIGTTDPTLWIESTSIGDTALTRTMPGLQLSCYDMNASSALYTPAIKFMSTDQHFTTENPKLLAAILGRATEAYGVDTDGGMALDFAVTADNPGTTNVPAVGMSLTSTGLGVGETVPLGLLHVRGTDTTGTVNAVADDLVIENTGYSGITVLSPNASSGGSIVFADTDDDLAGYVYYDHDGDFMNFAIDATVNMTLKSTGLEVMQPPNVWGGSIEVGPYDAVNGYLDISLNNIVGSTATYSELWWQFTSTRCTWAFGANGPNHNDPGSFYLFHGRDKDTTNHGVTLLYVDDDDNIEIRADPAALGASSYVAVDVDGSEVARFTSTGLGIGATPSHLLEVNGTADFDVVSTANLDSQTNTAGPNRVKMQAASSTDKFIRFRRGGSPSGNAGICYSAFDADHWFVYGQSGGALAWAYSTESSDNPDADSASIKMLLDTTGNLGIGGSDTPDTLLHIKTGDSGATPGFNSLLTLEAASSWVALQLLTSNTGVCAIYFGDGDDEGGARYQYQHTADQHEWYITNNQKMTLQASQLIIPGLIVAQDTDIAATIGRAKIGYRGVADTAAFAHYDFMTSTDAGFYQVSDGRSFMNAPTGASLNFRINNSQIGIWNASALQLDRPLWFDSSATVIDKDGGNNLSFTDAVTGTKTLAQLAGGGGAQISGTPADNQVAVWTNSTTVEGDADFTWDGTQLVVKPSGNPVIWLQNPFTAEASLSQDMDGIQLSAGTMDVSNEYTPAIKFMSTDANFTTENPKLLALIVGRATESYAADTDGGMALDFGVTADNPGTTNVPTVMMTLKDVGNTPRLGLGPSSTARSPVRNLHIRDDGDVYLRLDTNGSYVEIGCNSPYCDFNNNSLTGGYRFDEKITISNGTSSGVTPDVDQDDLFIQTSGHTGITIGSGTSSYGTLCFADSGHDEAARIMYAHGYTAYWILAENSQIMTWEYAPTIGGQLGITADFPDTKLHVEGGISLGRELVVFDQNDTDKPFIDFRGTAAANTTNTISSYTTTGACQGHLQIEVNGTKYWIPYYANPS